MSRNTMRFKTVRIYVENLAESIAFYSEVGFYVVRDYEEEAGVVCMKLSKKSDFMISLLDRTHTKSIESNIGIVINEKMIGGDLINEIDIEKQEHYY